MHDHVLGFDGEADLKVGGLVMGLSLAEHLDGSLSAMPVARIVERRADSGVVLDSRFIPPMPCQRPPAPAHLGGRAARPGAPARRGPVGAHRHARHQGRGRLRRLPAADGLRNRYEPLLHHWRMGPAGAPAQGLRRTVEAGRRMRHLLPRKAAVRPASSPMRTSAWPTPSSP